MNKERAAGLIFFLTGAYGFILSIQLPRGTWAEPGPAIFPLGISTLLILAGVLTFIFGKPNEKEGIDWSGMVRQLLTPGKIVGLTAAFILVLDRLGYLLASSLFIFLLTFLVSHYRVWVAMGLAITIGVGSWYFFGRILAVQLPGGLLAF